MSKQATPHTHTHSLSRQSWKNILHSLSSYFWFLLFIYFIFFCTFFDWFSLYKCSKLFILSHRRLDTPDWICIFYYFQFPILFLLVTWKEKKSMSFVLLLSLSSHTHTHTRHNFDSLTAYYLMMLLSLQPLWMTLLAWQNLLTSRLWFRAQHTEIPITKTKTRLKKKLLPCLSFFIYRTNFHFSWFVYFFHYLMCRHEQNTQTKFPLPRPYMCRERGERNPIVTCAIPHWTPPLWHASCLLTTAKPEIGRAHDTIVLFPVSFYSFFSLFFSTHTHTKAWKSSLTIFARPFLVLLSFLWTFSNNRKDQKTPQKKNAQTKTHLLYTTTTTTSLSNLVAAFFKNYFIFSLLKRFHPQTNILRLFFSLSHTHRKPTNA